MNSSEPKFKIGQLVRKVGISDSLIRVIGGIRIKVEDGKRTYAYTFMCPVDTLEESIDEIDESELCSAC